jgi:hypothetical protein
MMDRPAVATCLVALMLVACTASPTTLETTASTSVDAVSSESGGLIFGSGNRDGDSTDSEGEPESTTEGDSETERGGLIFGSGN